jgi:hypothetical protein
MSGGDRQTRRAATADVGEVVRSAARPAPIGTAPSVGEAVRVLARLTPIAVSTAADRLRRCPVSPETRAPGRIELVTPQWVNRVMHTVFGGARVESLSVERHSSGTSVRARIRLHYSEISDTERLPGTIFVKSTPTLVTRIGNGLTGTALTEAGFYNELRKSFHIEAPVGYYSAAEARSGRAVQLLEDLVQTRQATFCQPTTAVSSEQAESMVEQLALLHAQGAKLPLTDDRKPGWLRSYPQWWGAVGSFSRIRRYHLRGQRRADELGLTPPRLVGRGAQLWSSFEASVDAHHALTRTLIHGDPHLGNWYSTGDDRMGLCDWQCVSAGHWSRDLSYALASGLTIDQRREWEQRLVDSYLDRLASEGGAVPPRTLAWTLFRKQLPGALAMWTTTLCPPRFLPAMQPEATSAEMLHRILTAIDDHDVLSAI